MSRLWSTPPHTLGVFSPACRATSTNWTGDDVGSDIADSTTTELLHLQSGVVRASSKEPPSTTRDEPRKRRRGIFIESRHYIDRSWPSKRPARNPKQPSCLSRYASSGAALSETGRQQSPRSSLEGGNMINCQLRSCLSCHCIPGGLSPQLLEGAHFLLRLGGLALRPVNGCQEKMNRWLGRAILLGHK
jgi:hypothetical protein